MSTTGIPLVNTLLSVPLLTNDFTAAGETDTGYTFDGKTVFQQNFTGTTSATNGQDTIATITGMTQAVSFYGWWFLSGNDDYNLFNRTEQGTGGNFIQLRTEGEDFLIAHGDDYNSQNYHVVLFYIK
jgi:UDP-2,3-diacylglucosamine pyrophosphatase LpxH